MNASFGPNALSIRRPSCVADAFFFDEAFTSIMIGLKDPRTGNINYALADVENNSYYARIRFDLLPPTQPADGDLGQLNAEPNQVYTLYIYSVDYFDPTLAAQSQPIMTYNLHFPRHGYV